MIVFERGDLVMVFNFHPTQSYTDYKVGCLNNGEYPGQGVGGEQGSGCQRGQFCVAVHAA